ncbi:MAG: NADP-dependent oxidoreductase [Flavipsychrobacter sp.]|nr:NADP-dependent oxidoreductase [Flavipsychrobacter sp.]
MKAVKFDNYGGIDVLNVVDVPQPVPGKKQVLVKVKAAGINPGEASIREGKMAKQFPSTFPSGEGSDFAGIVTQLGADVTNFKDGDEVIGFSNERSSHAEFVLVESSNLIKRPANVSWEQAGSLFVVGTTAYAAVKAIALAAGDTVVVSAAAGGVGSIVVQLAKNIGAKVIGIASKDNHEWLSKHGAIPVAYGDNMEDDIKKAAGGKIDAFIDAFGKGYVAMAIKLGIPPERIDTIIDFEAAQKYGVKTDGNSKAATVEVLAELAQLMESGQLEIPIAKTYPLTEVREAYREIEKRHTHGKIVLIP